MQSLLIYYGYPSSFNNDTNGWDTSKVAEDWTKYELIVLNAVGDPAHQDHAKTIEILEKYRAKVPYGQLFGYVRTDQPLDNFEQQATQWRDTLDADGIFLDNAGYDFGTSRDEFNNRVGFVHSLNMSCFVNAWNVNHVVGTEEDPAHPNAQFNQYSSDSLLGIYDYYLLESFVVNTETQSEPFVSHQGYETAAQWSERVDKANEARLTAGVNLAGISVIEQSDLNKYHENQKRADMANVAATMVELEAWGTANHNYGATDGLTRWWPVSPIDVGDVPAGTPLTIEEDGDVRRRYYTGGNLQLDFTSGNQCHQINKTP